MKLETILTTWATLGCLALAACGASGGKIGSSGGGGAGTSTGSGGTGTAGKGGGAGAGGAGMMPVTTMTTKDPVILAFTATPPTLPDGGGQTMLTWNVVKGMTLSIDNGVGTVTGTSKTVSVTATTVYTLTATNTDGMATATTAVVVGKNPSSDADGRYSAMVAPTNGETFIAPATLRLIAAGRDPNVDTNEPSDGLGGNASKVQFFVDDQVVLEVDGSMAEYWVFKGFVTGIAAGQHLVWARSIYIKPDEVLDSPPQIVTVAAPPTYAQTVSLTGDVDVGSKGYSLVGTAAARIRLNGNGHKITGTGASGPLTLKFVDAFDLGDATDGSAASFDVETSGTITLEDSTFDTSDIIRLSPTDAATSSIQRNLFRSNMRMSIGQNPDGYNDPPSYPFMKISGDSTGAKVFAANNVGASWVEFDNANNWVVGGSTDADSNILIGPRAGISTQMCSNMQIRRNYSHHVYYGGWSQGANFELEGSPMMTVEHNVIYGSSWPVRGAGCEFRYNLVVHAGHEFLWPEPNGSIHHNVFVGGESDIAGIYVLYSPMNVKVFNNTLDGQLSPDMVTAFLIQNGETALTSNAFINVTAAPTITIQGGTLTADYNFFGNPQTGNYSDQRKPAHDVSGSGAAAAMLTDDAHGLAAQGQDPFDIDEAPIWKRATTVRDILVEYRRRYTPLAGSPLIDVGDPAGGAGNDIGAIGAGTPNAADGFGIF